MGGTYAGPWPVAVCSQPKARLDGGDVLGEEQHRGVVRGV